MSKLKWTHTIFKSLIVLSEFVLFYLKTNAIILENVCNWHWNRFIIKLFCQKKVSKIFVQNLSEIHKNMPKINLSVQNVLVLMYKNLLFECNFCTINIIISTKNREPVDEMGLLNIVTLQ